MFQRRNKHTHFSSSWPNLKIKTNKKKTLPCPAEKIKGGYQLPHEPFSFVELNTADH